MVGTMPTDSGYHQALKTLSLIRPIEVKQRMRKLMKSIHFIAVNYKSYAAAERFIRSVDAAAAACKDFNAVVSVIDNGAEITWQPPVAEHIKCELIAFEENLGYLGAAQQVWNTASTDYDFTAICNVDLELAPDFLQQLYALEAIDNCGWLAPDIYTAATQRHENPFMNRRPKKINFIIWKAIYSSTLLYRIYSAISALKRRGAHNSNVCDIYAGHGSFMLFTNEFAKQNPEIHFPGFMYCEELFLAELIRTCSMRTIYNPHLRIVNIGKVSTGLISQTKKSKWSLASLKEIEKQWF